MACEPIEQARSEGFLKEIYFGAKVEQSDKVNFFEESFVLLRQLLPLLPLPKFPSQRTQ
jgi:hypothetical protein